jgi:hypothetical protein
MQFVRSVLRPTSQAAALVATVALLVISNSPARADWHGGGGGWNGGGGGWHGGGGGWNGGGGWGWHGGRWSCCWRGGVFVGIAPPIYVAPPVVYAPPVYYPPPVVYYPAPYGYGY